MGRRERAKRQQKDCRQNPWSHPRQRSTPCLTPQQKVKTCTQTHKYPPKTPLKWVRFPKRTHRFLSEISVATSLFRATCVTKISKKRWVRFAETYGGGLHGLRSFGEVDSALPLPLGERIEVRGIRTPCRVVLSAIALATAEASSRSGLECSSDPHSTRLSRPCPVK